MRKLVVIPLFGEMDSRELINLVRNAITGVVDSVDFSRDPSSELHNQPRLVVMVRTDMSFEAIRKALGVAIEGVYAWGIQVYDLDERLFDGQDSGTSMR